MTFNTWKFLFMGLALSVLALIALALMVTGSPAQAAPQCRDYASLVSALTFTREMCPKSLALTEKGETAMVSGAAVIMGMSEDAEDRQECILSGQVRLTMVLLKFVPDLGAHTRDPDDTVYNAKMCQALDQYWTTLKHLGFVRRLP